MKKSICALLCLSLFLHHCSSTRHLYPLSEQNSEEVNTDAESGDITIVLGGSQEEIEAEVMQLDTDSLYFIYEENGRAYTIPTGLVREIEVKNKITGLLIGLGMGLIIGLIPYMAISSDENETGKDEALAQIGAFMVASIMIISGGVAGYLIGFKHYYDIHDPSYWSEFRKVETLIDRGQKKRAEEILDKIIDESGDEHYITTALFCKMKYELQDPINMYEIIQSAYPHHIYAMLAERLLAEEYGIRPVR
jgi:hypothetical protein